MILQYLSFSFATSPPSRHLIWARHPEKEEKAKSEGANGGRSRIARVHNLSTVLEQLRRAKHAKKSIKIKDNRLPKEFMSILFPELYLFPVN